MSQVLYPFFGVVVNTHSNACDPKVLRQEILVVVMAIRINIRLEGGHNVGILGRGNCLEEHGCAIPGVDEDLLLGLETEIEFIPSSQFQDAGVMVPPRLVERDRRIERWDRKFEDAPKQIIAILRLDTDGGELGLYLRISRREESREQFK